MPSPIDELPNTEMAQTGLEMRPARSRKIQLGIYGPGARGLDVVVVICLFSTISSAVMNWSGMLLVVGAASGHRGSKSELTDWKKLLISPASTDMSPP